MEIEILVRTVSCGGDDCICCPANQVAKLSSRQEKTSRRTKCLVPSTASHYFKFGCVSSGNSVSFKPAAITTV